MEEHGEGKGDGDNGVIMVDASTGREQVLISHADFFASPRVSQDGKKLVWVQWNLPHMVSQSVSLVYITTEKQPTDC